MGMPAKNIFAPWAKVAKDRKKPFNVDFVDFVFGAGIRCSWERDF
jgi:hypothetical protein